MQWVVVNSIDTWNPLQAIALHCMLQTLRAQTQVLSGSTWAQAAHSSNNNNQLDTWLIQKPWQKSNLRMRSCHLCWETWCVDLLCVLSVPCRQCILLQSDRMIRSGCSSITPYVTCTFNTQYTICNIFQMSDVRCQGFQMTCPGDKSACIPAVCMQSVTEELQPKVFFWRHASQCKWFTTCSLEHFDVQREKFGIPPTSQLQLMPWNKQQCLCQAAHSDKHQDFVVLRP